MTIRILLAVATPMHMIAPISDGTLSVVPVRNSIHRMPAMAPGRAVRMMNGSTQDWKFTVISRYTSTTAKIMPKRQTEEGGLHGVHLAAQGRGTCRAAGAPSSSRMIFRTSAPTLPRSRRATLA